MMNHSPADILIGIPTLNGPERLERCLASIERHTPCDEYKVAVLAADDCSLKENWDRNVEVTRRFGVPILRSEIRLGVAAQWNRLSRHSTAPIVILMNDDVEVVPDWLEPIVFSLRNNDKIGMVGLSAYTGVTTANFKLPIVKSYNVSKLERGHGMPSSTGFLFGFERKKFDAIDGFDPQFMAFYEEVDFGLRLLEKGWPSYMLSYPIVIHQGGATTSDTRNLPDPQGTMQESREKFKKKWSGIRLMRNMIQEPKIDNLKEWNTMLKTWVD